MALNLDPNVHMVFYEKVFGKSSAVFASVTLLTANGWKFSVKGLYTLSASSPNGHIYTTDLAKGYSSLMKGNLAPNVAEDLKQKIESWVSGLFWGQFGMTFTQYAEKAMPAQEEEVFTFVLQNKGPNTINMIKALRSVLFVGLKEAKDIVDNTPCVILDNAGAALCGKLASAINGVGGAVKWGKTGSEEMQGYTKEWVPKIFQGYKVIHTVESQDLEEGGWAVVINGQNTTKSTSQPQDAPIAPVGVSTWDTSQPVKKPIPQVIPLREANVLLQKVRGTSNGSVYYTIGLNERVKVAVRVRKSGNSRSLSFRIEAVNPTQFEKTRIAEAVDWKSGQEYGSMHVEAGDIPTGRVIGAFLGGLGIKLTEALMYSEELPVEAA